MLIYVAFMLIYVDFIDLHSFHVDFHGSAEHPVAKVRTGTQALILKSSQMMCEARQRKNAARRLTGWMAGSSALDYHSCMM